MCTRHYTALFSTQTIYNLSQNMKFILFICKVGVVTRCNNFFFVNMNTITTNTKQSKNWHKIAHSSSEGGGATYASKYFILFIFCSELYKDYLRHML